MFLDVCIIFAYMKDVIAKEIFLLLFRKSSCSLLFTPFYFAHYTWQSSQSLCLNENHKFSVEILKPRAWQESLTGRASKNFFACDQPPRLGDIVSCALYTRKEILERSRPISTKLTGSDGSRTFLKVFGVVTLSRLSVASSISYVCLSYNCYILAVQFNFSNWKWWSKKRRFSISQLDTTNKLLWKCLGDKFKWYS